MIRNKDLKSNIFYILIAAIITHVAILAFVKIELHNSDFLDGLTKISQNNTRPIKLDKIDFINKKEVEKIRSVGIKEGKKDLQRPDMPIQRLKPSPPRANPSKGSMHQGQVLSLDKLAPDLPKLEMMKKPAEVQIIKQQNEMAQKFLKSDSSNEPGHFYFNPKV